MWRLSEAELNCVSTKIRRMSACRQLLIGMSIRRYLPPIGTAGLDRSWVSGNSREPWPPPRMSARTSVFTARSRLLGWLVEQLVSELLDGDDRLIECRQLLPQTPHVDVHGAGTPSVGV